MRNNYVILQNIIIYAILKISYINIMESFFAMKRFLLLVILFGWIFAVHGQNREEIRELLTNSYNYMANGSFVLEDM